MSVQIIVDLATLSNQNPNYQQDSRYLWNYKSNCIGERT